MKVLLSILFLIQIPLLSAIELPALFSDGMVLQQKQANPVWGWAAPGTKVSVKFSNQSKKTSANSAGKWMLKLDPLKASAKSSKMTITVGKEKIVIKDILVGEVWLCGGQSNMEYPLSQLIRNPVTAETKVIADKIKKEISRAKDSLFRKITVKHMASVSEPLKNFSGSWVSSSAKNNASFSAVAYYFGRELREELKVPVGLIQTAWGGTAIEPWISKEAYMEDSELKAFYQKSIKRKVARPQAAPTSLYNGMIHSLIPYGIKGAIWYQGESNANAGAKSYEKFFSSLITSWRKAWKQGDYPFYFVQLANYKSASASPQESDPWAMVCDQQRLTLQLPNTGMVVTNDIGESGNIHPINKLDVGKRLSLWALKNDYQKKIAEVSGPLLESVQFKSRKTIVSFSHCEGGLMAAEKTALDAPVKTNNALAGFQICGRDRKWLWAEAKIISKNQVELSHAKVSKAIEVRYFWAQNIKGKVRLYNKAGLPASTFAFSK